MASFLRCFLICLVLTGLINGLSAQSGFTYTKKDLNIRKVAVFDPTAIKPAYKVRLINLEAPSPGGPSYREHLMELRKETRKKFPLQSGRMKSADTVFLSQPLYIDSFSLKYHQLIVSGPDTLIDKVEYFRDGGVPLDNTLAISNDEYLVCGINSRFYFHDLKTGKDPKTAEITVIDFEDLASDGAISTDNPFDPKVLYDPLADRFVLTFLSGRTPSTSNLILAFSTSNNPNDAWNVYELPGNPFDNGLWSDFPAISLTRDELFYTINLLVPGSDWKTLFRESVVWQIDKNSGYNGNAELDLTIWSDIALNGRNLRNLSVVQGGSQLPGPNAYFISNRNFDVENDSIFLVEITNTRNQNALLKISVLKSNQKYGLPPFGRQQNSDPNDPADGFDTNDSRVLGAYTEDDEIQFVGNSVDPETGRAAIYHGVITGLDAVPDLTGTIIGHTDLDFGYPNIVFTGSPECGSRSVIAFDHTSPSVFAGISALRYERDETGKGSYSELMTLQKGKNYVDRLPGGYERWGDYFGLQRKYNENGIVYAAGFYGTSSTALTGTMLSKLRDCACFDADVTETSLSPYNTCIGLIEAQISSGNNPISYTWNGITPSDSFINVNLCDYSYSLEVSDVHGCVVSISDSINKKMPENNPLLYPNPAQDRINVYFETGVKRDISVYIFSSEGKLVDEISNKITAEKGKNLLTFSVSPLSHGLYIIKLQDGDDVIMEQKFVVE